jgi:hypothetical protein
MIVRPFADRWQLRSVHGGDVCPGTGPDYKPGSNLVKKRSQVVLGKLSRERLHGLAQSLPRYKHRSYSSNMLHACGKPFAGCSQTDWPIPVTGNPKTFKMKPCTEILVLVPLNLGKSKDRIQSGRYTVLIDTSMAEVRHCHYYRCPAYRKIPSVSHT